VPLLPGKEDEVEQTEEPVELVERVCALDIGKARVMACVRVPHEDNPRRRRQEVREYVMRVPALLELADWLRSQSVQLVAMEATSSYWKPAFYLLEAEGFTCWLLNAKHVKNVPADPRPTGWTRCGWPRSSSAGCAGRAWCTPSRSATYAT
jgi:transposase